MKAMSSGDYSALYSEAGFHEGFATDLAIGHRFFFKRHRRKGGSGEKLLDVGTSTGLFVHRCQKKGINAIGIDTDEKALNIGKNLFPDIKLYHKTLSQLAKENAKFNYITLFEVLEHITSPKGLLEQCLDNLSVGGTLVVFVPNRNRTPVLYKEMIDRGIDIPPHHVTKWSKKSLRYLFETLGLRNIMICDIGKYRFPKIPSFGLASHVREKIVKTDTSTRKYSHTSGALYSTLSDMRIKIDKYLFFWIDLFYLLKGYEKDGLYIEGQK